MYTYIAYIQFLNFKVIFLKTTILKLEKSTQRKFYRKCFETEHIYSVTGKLLCNISPKTWDLKKKIFV